MKRKFDISEIDITDKNRKKISDRSLCFNILTAVIGVILCLASLSAATWAWFGSSVSATQNTLKTGVYSISVTVTDSDGNELAVKTDANGKDYYELLKDERYSLTLVGEGTVTSGYGILSYGSNTLYTEQIYTPAAEDTPRSISFLLLPKFDGSLYVSFCWGSYGESPQIVNGGEYPISQSGQSVGQE